jgi:hypothetical protein
MVCQSQSADEPTAGAGSSAGESLSVNPAKINEAENGGGFER